MITHEWSDWRNGDIWWIQSVYVHADFRRKGVFSAAVSACGEGLPGGRGGGAAAVYGGENAAAQATYERMGMQLTHYRVLEKMFQGNL